MTLRDPKIYLEGIVLATTNVRLWTGGYTFERFRDDPVMRAAADRPHARSSRLSLPEQRERGRGQFLRILLDGISHARHQERRQPRGHLHRGPRP